MYPTVHFAITGPAGPFILLVFGFFTLVIVDILIALVEGVALTMLRWNAFRTCLTVSLIMNLVSGIFNGVLLVLLQRYPAIWLPISFALAFFIDVFILTYFKRTALPRNSLYALLVNLASYLLLILPAYYFGSRG